MESPAPSTLPQVIAIYPVGLREKLVINLEMLCDCGFERPDHPGYIENAEQCNGRGTYQCGVYLPRALLRQEVRELRRRHEILLRVLKCSIQRINRFQKTIVADHMISMRF